MNAFPYSVGCDVCGGPGVGNSAANAAQWTRGATVAHSDPRVCRAYLDEMRRKIEAQEGGQ